MWPSPAVAIHERVWERSEPQGHGWHPPGIGATTWKPQGTYALLGIIVAIFILQQIVARVYGGYAHHFLFTIGWLETPWGNGWWLRPWSLITSTLSHSPVELSHILVNGLMLFFFGRILEQVLGIKRFLIWFFAAGALSGVVQVTLQSTGVALGASGAIMYILGALVILMPHEKVLIWGILPMPFWLMAGIYAVIDVLGVIGPADGVGNVAHLSGMALGLWHGNQLKTQTRR